MHPKSIEMIKSRKDKQELWESNAVCADEAPMQSELKEKMHAVQMMLSMPSPVFALWL